MEKIVRNIAVVGNTSTGKHSLLKRLTSGQLPDSWQPYLVETYTHNVNGVTIDNSTRTPVTIEFNLTVVCGKDEYDNLRSMTYPRTDLVIICFNVLSRPSLENVKMKWLAEVTAHCPGVPIILVGNKMDLRQDPHMIDQINIRQPIVEQEGKQMASLIRAHAYMECSAKTGEGVAELAEMAAKLTMVKRHNAPETLGVAPNHSKLEIIQSQCVVS